MNYSSQQTCAVLKIGEIPQFSWGIFGHLTHLDQSRESKDIIRLFKPIWCALFLFLFRRCGLTFSDLWPFCLPTLLYMWVWWHLRVYTMFEWWKKGVWLRWKDLQRLLWASKGRMRKQHHFEDDQERFMSRYVSVFVFLQSASYHLSLGWKPVYKPVYFWYFSREVGQFQYTLARFSKDKTMGPDVNKSTCQNKSVLVAAIHRKKTDGDWYIYL